MKFKKKLDEPRGVRPIAYRYEDCNIPKKPLTDKIVINTNLTYTYYLVSTNEAVINGITAIKRNPENFTKDKLPEHLHNKLSNEFILVNKKYRVLIDDITAYGAVTGDNKTVEDVLLKYFRPKHKDGFWWNYEKDHYHVAFAGFKENAQMWESITNIIGKPTHILIYRVLNERD